MGVGTQDDLSLARDFLAKGKITFSLLWDTGFESWTKLGISSQPSAVLVGADGKELGRWLGRVDTRESEILARVGR